MFNKRRLKASLLKKNTLNVVHDNDLESLLKSLDVYDSVVSGEKRCLFCNSIITLDNIDSIVPFEGTVQFTCDKKECHTELIGLR